MYDIIFYRDRHGHQPVFDYIKELKSGQGKDNRIKLQKIQDYIKILVLHGTRAGLPFVKHLEGNIWELRPINDRIMLGALVEGRFVLLHVFTKKTQKTPKEEIQRAKRELKDYLERCDGNE